MGYRNAKEVTWTRKKALETINYVMDLNKKDLERINDAYQTEIDLLEAQLMELAAQVQLAKTPQQTYNISKQMQDVTAQIAKCRKQRRTNTTNIKGIYEGAKILNRMFGYDITKVEIAGNDDEREEMEKLTVDELRALISINKEGD